MPPMSEMVVLWFNVVLLGHIGREMRETVGRLVDCWQGNLPHGGGGE